MKNFSKVLTLFLLLSLFQISTSIDIRPNKNENSLQAENTAIEIQSQNLNNTKTTTSTTNTTNSTNTTTNATSKPKTSNSTNTNKSSNSYNNTDNNGTKKQNSTSNDTSDKHKDQEKEKSTVDKIKEKLKGEKHLNEAEKELKRFMNRGMLQREEAHLKKREMCFPKNNCSGNGNCSKCDDNVDCTPFYTCNCNDGFFGYSCEFNNKTFNQTLNNITMMIKQLKAKKFYNTTQALFQAFVDKQNIFQAGALNATIQTSQIDLLAVVSLYIQNPNQLKFVLKSFSDISTLNENVPPLVNQTDEQITNISNTISLNQLKIVDFYKEIVQNYGQDQINEENQTFFYDNDKIRFLMQFVDSSNVTLNFDSNSSSANASVAFNVTTGFLQFQQNQTTTLDINTTDSTQTIYTIEMPQSTNQNISLPTQIEALPSPYIQFTDDLFYAIKKPSNTFNISDYNLQASLILQSRDQVKFIKNAEHLVSQILTFQLVFASKNSSNSANNTFEIETNNLPSGQCVDIFIPRDIEMETALNMVNATKSCVYLSNIKKAFINSDNCELVGITTDNYYQCCCSKVDPLQTTFAIKSAKKIIMQFIIISMLILLGLLFI